MTRRCAAGVVLSAAALATPAFAVAAEVPVAELASRPFLAPVPTPQAATIPAPAVRLAWLDPAGVAFGTEAVVQREVERTLERMGVESSWRRGENHEVARPGELRVIFLDRGAQREHGTPVLGATPSRFAGEPFVWVHVPSVRAAAGLRPRSGPDLELAAVRRLGVALARVIAHEVVHAVAPGVPHGSGLMAPRLDQRMLTASRIGLDPEVGFAVRAALRGAGLPPGPAAAEILAAESGRQLPSRQEP